MRFGDSERLFADSKCMMRPLMVVVVIGKERANVVVQQIHYLVKANSLRISRHLPDLRPDALSVHGI